MQFTTQKSQKEEFNRLIAEERRIFLKRRYHKMCFVLGRVLVLLAVVLALALVLVD